jgi:hypothetical protein
MGLLASEFAGCQDFGAHSNGAIHAQLAAHFGHLFLVGSHPERTGGDVLHVGWELARAVYPQAAGIPGEGDLRGRIVHHHDMAHAGRGRSAADGAGLHDHHREPRCGALLGAGRAHDAASGDGYVEGVAHERGIP